MKKTITIEDAVAFLNLCAAADPRNTTELLDNRKVAGAVKGLFSEDGDKMSSIQINRSKTGAVVGFSEIIKLGKKQPPQKPKPPPLEYRKENDVSGRKPRKEKVKK